MKDLLQRLPPIKKGMSFKEVVTVDRINAIQEAIAALSSGKNVVSGPGILKQELPDLVVFSATAKGGGDAPAAGNHPFQVLDATQTDPETKVKTPWLGVYQNSDCGYAIAGLWDGKTDKTGDPAGLIEVPPIGGAVILEVTLNELVAPQWVEVKKIDDVGSLITNETASGTVDEIAVTYVKFLRVVLAKIEGETESTNTGFVMTIGGEKRKVVQTWQTDMRFALGLADGLPARYAVMTGRFKS